MNRRNRKRVTYRPSKSQAIFSGVMGIVFVFIGVLVAIPNAGAFGVLWTLAALVITGMNFYQAFGKGYIGPQINIEEDGEGPTSPPGDEPQVRLEQLRVLYEQRLITQEEYEEKRKEILKEL